MLRKLDYVTLLAYRTEMWLAKRKPLSTEMDNWESFNTLKKTHCLYSINGLHAALGHTLWVLTGYSISASLLFSFLWSFNTHQLHPSPWTSTDWEGRILCSSSLMFRTQSKCITAVSEVLTLFVFPFSHWFNYGCNFVKDSNMGGISAV